MKNDEIAKLKLHIEALSDVTMTIGIHALGKYSDEELDRVSDKKSLPYQAGWNDAIIEISKRIHEIESRDWKEMSGDLYLLLNYGGGFLMDDKLHLNMNDTFAFACADCEEVPDDKIAEVASLYSRFGYCGLVYWVSKQRNWEMPYAPDGPSFAESKKEIKRIRKIMKKAEKLK